MAKIAHSTRLDKSKQGTRETWRLVLIAHFLVPVSYVGESRPLLDRQRVAHLIYSMQFPNSQCGSHPIPSRKVILSVGGFGNVGCEPGLYQTDSPSI